MKEVARLADGRMILKNGGEYLTAIEGKTYSTKTFEDALNYDIQIHNELHIDKLNRLFDEFNEHYYHGELKRPMITSYPDLSKKALGWVTTVPVWVTNKLVNNVEQYELNISANFLNLGFVSIAGTLLHEMAHLYNLQHGVRDVSNNGYYHNKNFKRVAEAHGLKTFKARVVGIDTDIADSELEYIDSLRTTFNFVRATWTGFDEDGSRVQNIDPPKPKEQNTFTYYCPKCGERIRSNNPDANIICGDCGVKFIRLK